MKLRISPIVSLVSTNYKSVGMFLPYWRQGKSCEQNFLFVHVWLGRTPLFFWKGKSWSLMTTEKLNRAWYSKAPSYTAPRCTDPTDTRVFLSPKFFQIHGFPNVGHYFTPQLHGYKLVPIVKKVTRFLSYTVFQNTLRQCNSGPYCTCKREMTL